MDLEERRLGPATVYFGDRGGKYPDGNSLLVRGAEETVVIDPALGMVARKGALPHVDRILNSHCHEDHVAGNFLFPDASCHLHEADVVGMRSLDDFMAIFGYEGATGEAWRRAVVERFHYEPRPDAEAFADDAVFDLGAGVSVRAIHTPGHTRGHCALLVEPDGILYLGDIDLSSFGPYYGDAWSDLLDFERSLEKVREIDVPFYATFHHIGVLEGREAYLERLDRFAGVIRSREERLLAYLDEPHTLDEIAGHRFVYRPGDDVPNAEAVERRHMRQHLRRLLAADRVRAVGESHYQTV